MIQNRESNEPEGRVSVVFYIDEDIIGLMWNHNKYNIL